MHDSSALNLPPCAYRATVGPHFVCRHSRVLAPSGVVPPKLCQICRWLDTPSDGLRPLPTLDQIERDPSPPRSRGLGDTIVRLTRWLGLRPCGKCQRRRDALNRLFPYGKK
jgi:hypothetical protein